MRFNPARSTTIFSGRTVLKSWLKTCGILITNFPFPFCYHRRSNFQYGVFTWPSFWTTKAKHFFTEMCTIAAKNVTTRLMWRVLCTATRAGSAQVKHTTAYANAVRNIGLSAKARDLVWSHPLKTLVPAPRRGAVTLVGSAARETSASVCLYTRTSRQRGNENYIMLNSNLSFVKGTLVNSS